MVGLGVEEVKYLLTYLKYSNDEHREHESELLLNAPELAGHIEWRFMLDQLMAIIPPELADTYSGTLLGFVDALSQRNVGAAAEIEQSERFLIRQFIQSGQLRPTELQGILVTDTGLLAQHAVSTIRMLTELQLGGDGLS